MIALSQEDAIGMYSLARMKREEDNAMWAMSRGEELGTLEAPDWFP